MLPIIDRNYLQELRDTANGMVAGNLNPDWCRAYQALADAADRLDAMQARLGAPWAPQSEAPSPPNFTPTDSNRIPIG